MKTYLIYGLGIALAGAILSYAEYFLGFHNDIEKFKLGQIIGTIGGLGITIIGLYLGIRAVRESSPDQSLSYGRGVGAGALIGVFAGIFGAISYYVYGTIVNPEFHDVLFDYQMQQAEAKGIPVEQMEAMEGMMRFFAGPTWISIATLLTAPIFCVIVALILSAFLKRKPAAEPPPLAA